MSQDFEPKEINKETDKYDRQKLWLQFLNAETEEELDMLESTNVEPIQKAVRIIRKMSEDEEVQELVRLRKKALGDEVSAMYGARKEGRAEERAEIIAKMRSKGMKEEQIKELLE